MASKNIFRSFVGKLLPRTNKVNHEGAPAYSFSPRHALAQYVATGCLNSTFYADGAAQLEKVLELAGKVEPEFIAKCAVYGREKGLMRQWNAFAQRNPGAKLVCLDLQPYDHTQAPDRSDILNIGGFSDSVFDVISAFGAGRLNGDTWVNEVERVSL